MDRVKQDEQKLAEKARQIFELKQALQELEEGKTELQQEKPKADKDKLTYEESVEFGSRIDDYNKRLHQLELQIMKLRRRLTSLELQAAKLIPVSGVKIKVCNYCPHTHTMQSYCIREVKTDSPSQSEYSLEVERL